MGLKEQEGGKGPDKEKASLPVMSKENGLSSWTYLIGQLERISLLCSSQREQPCSPPSLSPVVYLGSYLWVEMWNQGLIELDWATWFLKFIFLLMQEVHRHSIPDRWPSNLPRKEESTLFWQHTIYLESALTIGHLLMHGWNILYCNFDPLILFLFSGAMENKIAPFPI